jgi:hypothetical protein
MEEVRRTKEWKDTGENTEDDSSSATSLIPLPLPVFPVTKLVGSFDLFFSWQIF